MSKYKVKSGKGELTLRKSRTLVGLRLYRQRSMEASEPVDYIDTEIHTNLGGFNVVSLKTGGEKVDDKLDEVREREEVEVGTHVYFAEGSNKPLVPTGELFIVFEDGVDEEEQQIALDEFKLELVERRSTDTIVARVTDRSPNPIKVAGALQAVSLVNRAEPDIDTILDSYEFYLPPDHLLSQQWQLDNRGFVIDTRRPLKPGADARVVNAWRRLGNMGDSKVIIALIDNGFDLRHPDLRNKVVRPFDLWTQSDQLVQGDARFTHGTPCATVALAASNGKGIVGAAPNARFMPVSGTSFSLRATEQMFDYCLDNGADIISCSWGTTDSNFSLSPLKEQAIANAARKGRNGKGCVIVFAVGNDGLDMVNFYAAHPDVIAVSACTSRDQHAPYANRGREVSVCAPSNGDFPIIAGRAWWDRGLSWEQGSYKYWRDGKPRGDHYKHFGGTSSAAPLVAGICALMLSANPELTAVEVKEILQQTADKIGDPSDYQFGHSRKFGHGRVNADKAVAEAMRRRDLREPPAGVENSVSSGQGLFELEVKQPEIKGWGVQTGAFADYGNVLIQSEKMRSRFGQPVYVNVLQSNGRTIYKLITGNFSDYGTAQHFQQQLRAAGIAGFVTKVEG